MNAVGRIKAKVLLSANLRAILEGKPEVITVEIDQPMSIKELLVQIDINPLVVVMALVNGTKRSKDFRIEHDAEITLLGPVAGG